MKAEMGVRQPSSTLRGEKKPSMETHLLELQRYLTREFPGCTLIPSQVGGKIPDGSHKNGQHTADDFLNARYKKCKNGCLIILSADLIVLDVDFCIWNICHHFTRFLFLGLIKIRI